MDYPNQPNSRIPLRNSQIPSQPVPTPQPQSTPARLLDHRELKPASGSKRTGLSRRNIVLLLLALFVLAAATAGYFYQKYSQTQKQLAELKSNSQQAAQDEIKTLIDKIGQLIVLPADEQPTVATVTDLAPLKDQPFFAQAKVGYKVLIYTKAQKAILYDPVGNKIVEVAPINIGNNNNNPTNTTDSSPSNKPLQ